MDEIEAEAAMETPEVPWYAHHGNLADVARDMAEHGDSPDYIIDMLEKPWKWQETWDRISTTREGELAAMRDARDLRDLREQAARDRRL